MSIYPISAGTPRAQDSSPTSNDNSATSSAADYTSMFMQLLTTELQSQDPTQTMDPTTMVTQMVQINELNDVAGIYSILQGADGSSNTTNDAVKAHSAVNHTAGTSAANHEPSNSIANATSHSANPSLSNPVHSTNNTVGGN